MQGKMTSFFEKLKKGMEIKGMPEEKLIEEKKKTPKEKKFKKKKIEVHPVEEEPAVAKTMAGEKEKIEKKWFKPEGQLTVDVYQTDKEIVIQSAVAGIKPEDLDISIEKDMVIIRGDRERLLEKEERNYFYQECYWGRFSREIILPAEVDSSRAKAAMEKGILTIRIPKIERKKKKKIVVK